MVKYLQVDLHPGELQWQWLALIAIGAGTGAACAQCFVRGALFLHDQEEEAGVERF